MNASETPARVTSSGARTEGWLVLALLVFGVLLSFRALQSQRAQGLRPQFYQYNFGPAVMMACGQGFSTTTTQFAPNSLIEFLNVQRDRFDCVDLPHPLPLEKVTWNGTWYYLYAATALVWRISGISWKALDWLAAVLGGLALIAQYGICRLVIGRWHALGLALLLMLSPANLTQLLMLRDYSKAPFVLASVFVIGLMVIRPMTWRATLALAAAFGAVVGVGYGFRSDLLIMVPFGLGVIGLLLPGSWRIQWRRNLAAVSVALASFLVVGWPALRGLETGGCQFHYSLLGLTTPFTRALGLQPSIYTFGDHFLDAFVDLKVGDYGHRVMNAAPPVLCAPEYDRVSGHLFRDMATTFPADLIVRTYGAGLTVLREGVVVPSWSGGSRLVEAASSMAHDVTHALMAIGPFVTAAAVAVAWNAAPRLGIALVAFVLFLTGYPAIEFEERHWFHLRFIPWWAAALVLQSVLQIVRSRTGEWSWRRAGAGFLFVGIVLAALAAVLGAARLVQERRVSALVNAYLAAPIEPLRVTRPDSSILRVGWNPADYGVAPNHRSSDLIVVSIAATGCLPARALDLVMRYQARLPTHDMSSTTTVMRGEPGGPPTRVFVPVFALGFDDQDYLRFAGIEVHGASSECITEVARVTDLAHPQLWLQLQVPPGWQAQRLYQPLNLSRLLTPAT